MGEWGCKGHRGYGAECVIVWVGGKRGRRSINVMKGLSFTFLCMFERLIDCDFVYLYVLLCVRVCSFSLNVFFISYFQFHHYFLHLHAYMSAIVWAQRSGRVRCRRGSEGGGERSQNNRHE